MAEIQAAYLLRQTDQLGPEAAVPQAVSLIRDYVRQLGRPAQALAFALAFHPRIERWATWSVWAVALDLVLAAAPADTSALDMSHLLNCRSQAARELGDDGMALQAAAQALGMAEAQQDDVMIATALNKLGLIAFKHDELAVARERWERAYALGRSRLPALELGHITMNLGLVAVAQHRFLEADRYFQLALDYYQSQNDVVAIAKVQCNIADLRSKEGRLEGIETVVLAARETLKTLGAHYSYAMVENDIGCIYLKLKDFERAHQAFQAALSMLEQVGGIVGQARVCSNLAELYVSHARWKEAAIALREARRLAEVCQKPLFIAAVDVDHGRMLAAHGDLVGAQQLLEQAFAVQSQKGAQAAARDTLRLIEELGDHPSSRARTR